LLRSKGKNRFPIPPPLWNLRNDGFVWNGELTVKEDQIWIFQQIWSRSIRMKPLRPDAQLRGIFSIRRCAPNSLAKIRKNQKKFLEVGRKFCTDSGKIKYFLQSPLTATFCSKFAHFLKYFQPFDSFFHFVGMFLVFLSILFAKMCTILCWLNFKLWSSAP
jgi:hypothetical protein